MVKVNLRYGIDYNCSKYNIFGYRFNYDYYNYYNFYCNYSNDNVYYYNNIIYNYKETYYYDSNYRKESIKINNRSQGRLRKTMEGRHSNF